ncbi:MAG: hypothetical protein U0234_25075 [Sandaracinus sp.]
MDQIPVGVAKAVLAQDVHDQRFEVFCCDLVGDIEGDVLVVPTSASWDRGRDGRSVGGQRRVLVCASLTPRLDPKVEDDLKKIIKSGIRFEKVYYCTSQPTSEHTLDGICAELRSLMPQGAEIEPLSGEQIARLSSVRPASMWKHYRAEVEDIWRNIVANDEAPEAQRHSLLLALATAGHENSTAIRRACYEAVILRALVASGGSATSNEIATRVSNDLGLGRPIPVGVITDNLGAMVKAGLAASGARWSITDAGRAAADEHAAEAAKQLLEGRRDVRVALEGSVGFKFSDTQFDAIWNAVEQKLAHLFLTQGYRIVALVSGIIAPAPSGSQAAEDHGLPFFVDELARTASATCGSASPIRGEVEQALRDLFAERTSIAYAWMTRVCAAYITVCTLGLEASSGARLRDAIAKTHLIYDTDIVLTLFGAGEPEHEAAESLTREWRRLGGTLLLARPVAEEAAYHAHIADRDFEEGQRFLRPEHLRVRFLKNVFTRSFGFLVEQGTRPGDWRRYIAQYQGDEPYDSSSVREILRDEYAFRDLPDASVEDEPARSAWTIFEREVDRRELNPKKRKEALDKARGDARLYGAMVTYAQALRGAGGGAAAILVTSSGRLQNIGSHFDADGTWTLSLAEATYLLSMIPGVTVGLSGLRALLFDGRLSIKRKEFDLLVLRTLHDAGYTFPDARRSGLVRSVRKALVKRAKDTGEKRLLPNNILQTARTDEDAKTVLTEAIADALDAVGGDTPADRENARLRERIRELEKQLAKRSGD